MKFFHYFKKYLLLSAVSFTVIIVVPVFIAFFTLSLSGNHGEENTITLYNVEDDKIIKMPLEKYIVNVVAGEMPASFHTEALKAQAVATRTYSLKKMKENTHENGANLCTDPGHCQAYKDEEAMKNNWGKDYKKYYKKIVRAVNDTKSVIMEYKGEPISAVYHSTSPGKTQNAAHVWGSHRDYLVSVDSSVDKNSPKFLNTAEFTESELIKKLGLESESFIVEYIGYNTGGTVDNAVFSGKTFKGVEVRTLLSLKSACFEIEKKEDRIVFNTKGYGHGVGMSQWGANLLAKEGMRWEDILKKYYKGIDIEKKNYLP